MKAVRASLALLLLSGAAYLLSAPSDRAADERLSFQTSGPWSPPTNLNADVAMVYGIGPRMPDNIESWRAHGYRIHVMTGVAWGQYQDYLNGEFDGQDHWDQAQTQADGKLILHGGSATIPYISPGENYGHYLTVGVKRALDAGAQAIHLEEPEFWARGGWEENFKREWKAYYHEDWRSPDSSPDAQYRASKLKYYLYRRTLAQIFDFVKEYSKVRGAGIRCYVPTHSLINYAHWRIVSPESSLIQVGADGYIAQVWTGTARTANVYEGRTRERTFETAFLEYGAMQNLVRASGRRVWYLNDPIEDDPNHDWEDYRANWESTLTASLLQPEVWHYEIMPWPDRVFNSRHPLHRIPASKLGQSGEPAGTGLSGFKSNDSVERVRIPKPYETELQSVISALGDMKQSDVQWDNSGTAGVGVLVSDTMMFQRAAPHPSDPDLGSFYGLAMPLVKHGIPVEPVQMETAATPGFLNRYKLLILTYEGQKPPAQEFHTVLAQWIRGGGALVVIDNDRDPYNSVREWWNQMPLGFRTPRAHLFQALGIRQDSTGLHRVGLGVVVRKSLSPAALTRKTNGADIVRKAARQAAAAIGLPWKECNSLVLRRGPYVAAVGLDESLRGVAPYVLRGRYINLFDPQLSVVSDAAIGPGVRMLLLDVDRAKAAVPRVFAAACRVRDQKMDGNTLEFLADGIGGTAAVVRIGAAVPPAEVLVGGEPLDASQYDYQDGLLRLRFPNTVEPLPVSVRFAR